jgi:hypothetical protein
MGEGGKTAETREIGYSDLRRLQVDTKGPLLWDGDLVQVQRTVTLSRWQAVAGIVVAFGALAQGLTASHDIGCWLRVWAVGCQASTHQ